MNNSNVGQNDLSLDVKVQNDEPGFNVMRAVSENVNLQQVKFDHRDDLTAGTYEKDKISNMSNEPDITFEESTDSKKTTI